MDLDEANSLCANSIVEDTESCNEDGPTCSVDLLLEIDHLSTNASVQNLKEAEFLAEESFEWAMVANDWLRVFGQNGLANAVRCTERAQCTGKFVAGLLSIVGSWLRITELDSSYLSKALECMNTAEEDLEEAPNPLDACLCARAWIKFPIPQARRRALAMLKYAEILYVRLQYSDFPNRTEADDRKGLLDYHCRIICETWIQCFGDTVGIRCKRKFLTKTGGPGL
jgi:hypothetical protein